MERSNEKLINFNNELKNITDQISLSEQNQYEVLDKEELKWSWMHNEKIKDLCNIDYQNELINDYINNKIFFITIDDSTFNYHVEEHNVTNYNQNLLEDTKIEKQLNIGENFFDNTMMNDGVIFFPEKKDEILNIHGNFNFEDNFFPTDLQIEFKNLIDNWQDIYDNLSDKKSDKEQNFVAENIKFNEENDDWFTKIKQKILLLSYPLKALYDNLNDQAKVNYENWKPNLDFLKKSKLNHDSKSSFQNTANRQLNDNFDYTKWVTSVTTVCFISTIIFCIYKKK